jgi:hypothetical protein
MYVTWYTEDGWTPRRTWCMDCCPEEVDPGTDGADEAILTGIFWDHQLVSVETTARNRA